jgi:hypothetical protein
MTLDTRLLHIFGKLVREAVAQPGVERKGRGSRATRAGGPAQAQLIASWNSRNSQPRCVNETVSRWYPTMRPFRQQRVGDWEAMIARVAEALARFERS